MMYIRNDSSDYGIGFYGITFAEPGAVVKIDDFRSEQAARQAMIQNPKKFSLCEEADFVAYATGAAALEVEEAPTPYEQKTVPELRDLANDRGVEGLTSESRKADIVAALEAADQAELTACSPRRSTRAAGQTTG